MTDLERALLDLDVEWPATPDIAAAVRVRIAAEPAPRRRAARRLPSLAAGWRVRLAYVVAAVLLLGGGTLAASPEARSAVLEWLGLKSVEIRREPPTATPGPRSRLGQTLGLGQPVTLAEARQAGRAPVLVPAALGDPDAVYEGSLVNGQPAITLVYAPRERLPASDVTGVALLVQTFEAAATPFIQKTASSADAIERLDIDGARAYWITGSHGFAFQTERGVSFEGQRLADRTLLMERDGLLVRIEGGLTRARAVEIARSMPR